jgi:hypothetical protein
MTSQLPALHSVTSCPKCGHVPATRFLATGFGLRYQEPCITRIGEVPGMMTRYCVCGYVWAERPLDTR